MNSKTASSEETKYELVVGLEIHVQLATQSKMFSRCSADWFGKPPNSVVCPVSLGLPGALPVPNKKAIQWAILIGKALNCSINTVSKFDRKHYFYPDLPKGYQISQYDKPFSYDGYYDLKSKRTGDVKRIRITRVHLEEDTGKLIHSGSESLVDFNRAGVPLVEIVTEADFDNSDDVKQFLEELQIVIRYLGVSEADMEKGSMRLEPNISVRPLGSKGLPPYKVEVKNINSFRYAKQAIDTEYERHSAILDSGTYPIQETRGYDERKGTTFSQRTKEEAADYRYFPDPDIPPFTLSEAFISDIDAMLCELPHTRCERFEKLGVSRDAAYILTRSRRLADTFERIVQNLEDLRPKIPVETSLEHTVALFMVNFKDVAAIHDDDIVGRLRAKYTVAATDHKALDEAVDQVLAAHQDAVAAFKTGKTSVIMFLVGQTMKLLNGKAQATEVRAALEDRLKQL